MRRLAVIACLFLLAGCQSPLSQLHSADPQANDFASSLAAEYMAYGDSEAEQGRDKSAQYFAAKGVKALEGETVDPELPAATLPKPVRDNLIAARGALIAVLTDDIKRVAPQKSARAQQLFDCWQHQENRNASEKIIEEIAPCADEFHSTLTELQGVAESFVQGKETVHTVNFASGSTALDEDARAAIKEITGDVACLTDYKIGLQGYPKARKATRALVAKRIAAIRKEFIRRGVPASRIKLKKANDSKVVHLSSDMVKGSNQVDIMVRTFGQFGRQG
jgi:hypothetical protein